MLPLILKYVIGYLGIGIVVIIHELGHFLAARALGITVEVFSFGMGPRLAGWMIGETEIRLSMLPFGGYCRMKGTDDLNRALETKSKHFDDVEDGSIFAVHPFKRFLTYAAGPLANLLFAVFIYASIASLSTTVISTPAYIDTVDDYPAIFLSATSPAHGAGLKSGDLVLAVDGEPMRDYQMLEDLLLTLSSGKHTFLIEREGRELTIVGEPDESGRWGIANRVVAVVGQVRRGSKEEKAGLMAGDKILQCNGIEVEDKLDLLTAMGKERAITLVVQRGTEQKSISFIAGSNEDGSGDYQFSMQTGHRTQKGAPFSLRTGFKTSMQIFSDTVRTLYNIISGNRSDVRQELTGAGRAALMIGDIATLGMEFDVKSGIRSLYYLLGIVSVSLAVGNLLPLPAFDGGQLLISLFETVTRKRVSPRSYWVLQLVGMSCVILIMLLLTYVDMRHLYLVWFKR